MENPKLIDHKFLQRARGFYNHLVMTIDFLPPALKGFHNVIDGWRDGQDIDCFRDEAFHYMDILLVHLAEERISEAEFDLLTT